MRRPARIVADALLGAAIALPGIPFVATASAFSSATSSPENSFRNLEVAAASLAAPSVSGGSVGLSWTASPTASTESVSYLVRRRSGSGAYSTVGTTTGLSWNDTPGDGSWEYLVRTAVSSFSADSGTRSVTIDRTGPSAPAGLTAVMGVANGTVNLAWIAAVDAVTGVSGYTIRYVQATTCPAASAGAYPSTLSAGAVTARTVSGLQRTKNYCFYVVAMDGAGNQSAPSNVASAKAR